MVTAIIPSFLVLLCGILLCLPYRNKKVFKYRVALIDVVHKLTCKDIEQDRPWLWRWRAFEAVSYGEMFWKFWKPLDSFYTDRRFLEP